MKSFPEISPEELQYELLNHGLFDPIEWTDIEKQVRKMEKQSVWQIVDEEYQFLKGLWQGPEISIYIFPISKMKLKEEEQAPSKNGVAYKGGLFLFLTEGLVREEIKALFAHEYNHVCRLNYLGLESTKISLKESLVIEGLGEFAVKELYGEKWMAPWTNLYSLDRSIKVWNEHFIPQLNLMGVGNHQTFLYGNGNSRLPKWIGYHIGFQIIDTYKEKNGPFNDYELYRKSSDELIAGSIFPESKLY